jgi:hypothetical protein
MIELSKYVENRLAEIYKDVSDGKLEKAQRKLEKLILNLYRREDEKVYQALLDVKAKPNTLDKRIEQLAIDIEGVE